MTNQQYEAAQTILQMSRIYTKAMRECMEHSGVLKAGYELHVCVNQEHEIDDTVLLNTSMHCAKDYRTRYTLFKLISECGLEDEYLAEYPIA